MSAKPPPAFNPLADYATGLSGARTWPESKRFRATGRISDFPFSFPQTFEDGGGLIAGIDVANAGNSMTRMIHWPIQAKPVKRNVADWRADLHTGFIMFIRCRVDQTEFRDGSGERRTYNQFEQRAEVFALHQLNAILHRLSLGFDGATEDRIDPENVYNEFKLAGVLTTNQSEIGPTNGNFSVVNVKMQGDVRVVDVFGAGENGEAGDWLQLVVKRVLVPDESILITFTGKTAVPQRLNNYHRVSNTRVRYITQIVPMITPHKFVPAKHAMSRVDNGDRFEVRVPGRVYTLGQIWHKNDGRESLYTPIKNTSHYYKLPPKDHADGARSAKAVMTCGSVAIKVNVA